MSGIQNFGGNPGGIIAPALTGYSVSATGSFILAFAVCGFLLVFGVLCYWRLVSERVEVDRTGISEALHVQREAASSQDDSP